MSAREQDWTRRLERAALPGAAVVRFCWQRTEEGVSFALKSRDADDKPIGDDRDYDILKAVIAPLERLAEAEGFDAAGAERCVALELSTQALSFSFRD